MLTFLLDKLKEYRQEVLTAVLSLMPFYPASKLSLVSLGRGSLKIAAVRYVDDAAFLSYTICSRCLASILSHVFLGVISFEVASPLFEMANLSTVAFKYLDVIVHFSFSGLRLYMEHANFAYAFLGNETDMAKRSVQPSLGKFTAAIVKSQRSELRGRLERWRKMKIEPWNFLILAIVDMLLFFVRVFH